MFNKLMRQVNGLPRLGGTTRFLRKWQAPVPPIIPPGPDYPRRASRGIVYNLKRGRR